ncbi:MAG: potassium/proton antiporter [Ignavibacteria bacterium]
MISIESLLLIGSALILVSIGIAKLFDNLGVPTLIIFIGIGMLAGSEGPGGIYFDDPVLSQAIGIIALIFILFSGGLETKWSSVKKIVAPAAWLATVGVFLTAITLGFYISYVFSLSLLIGLLIASIISSTDAAAVFSILRSKNISLKGNIQPLLELESGSNDPMAVFLTIGMIQLILNPEKNIPDIVLLFFLQMGIGAVVGFFSGKLIVYVLNRLKFPYEGIYPVFMLAFIVMTFSITAYLNGSGFLAVYIVGIMTGNSLFVQKRGAIRFFDGLAWLSQIAMFVALGLLVFPNELMTVIGSGLLIAAFLIFIARPLSVFGVLAFFKFNWREKVFISWVGLRGAVPIVLATFPLIAGIPQADMIFNIVFFIVLTSAVLQGWLLPPIAKLLKLNAPIIKKPSYPIEFNPVDNTDTELVDFIVPYYSKAVGRNLVELGFPDDSRVVLIWRNEKSIVPSGGTSLEAGDALLILVNKNNINKIKEILSENQPPING